MALTPLTNYPDRTTQTQSAFNAAWTAFFLWFVTFVSEVNATETTMQGYAADAISAGTTSAVWVSGTTYVIGNVRYSPTNYANYRRKTNGAGTTDPASDTTNWAPTQATANLSLTGTTTFDVLVSTSATDSSSTTTGAGRFSGGVGIVKALYVGGVANLTGGANISGGTSANNIWYGTTHGLQSRAVTGSTSDWSLWNVAVTVQLLKNPTGTNNLVSGGSFSAGSTINTGLYTVATLATLPAVVQGARAFVTDASSPTWGATVVGGGDVVTPVFYNGSAWKCM